MLEGMVAVQVVVFVAVSSLVVMVSPIRSLFDLTQIFESYPGVATVLYVKKSLLWTSPINPPTLLLDP